jgi:superfamily I DNA/RNA helicase
MEYGNRFLKRLERGEGDAGRYDAVLVDEYQDFGISWLKCVKLALKEPEDGDLLIVGDASQSLYDQTGFGWIQAGIRARGRTATLATNYRNTREIISTVQGFATAASELDSEGLVQAAIPSADACQRSGPPVEIIQCTDLFGEVETAVDLIKKWIGEKPGSGRRLPAHEIGVLYPRLETPRHRAAHYRLRQQLQEYGTVQLAGEGADGLFTDPGIKITTILSSKGLQFRAVILL